MRTSNFWKISCYRPLRSQRKNFINWKINVKQTFWTIKNCFLTFVMFDIRRKNGPKSFIHREGCLFFKKLCFQQPLKSWRNDLITFKVIVRLVSGPLKTIPWGLSSSNIREKIGQNFFFTGKLAFFSKNCVFNNLLGPKELML